MKTLLALTAAILSSTSGDADDFPDISIEDLKKAIEDKKIVVVDVNGNNLWQKARIPGAINFAASKDNPAELLPPTKTRAHRSVLRQTRLQGV